MDVHPEVKGVGSSIMGAVISLVAIPKAACSSGAYMVPEVIW